MSSDVLIEKKDGCIWVTLPETVTMYNSLDVENEIFPHLSGGADKVVLDLSRTISIYSSGMGLWIRLRRHIGEKGGMICLVNVPRRIRDLLLTLNLERVFPIFATDVEFEISQNDVWEGKQAEIQGTNFFFVAQVETGIYRLNLSGNLTAECDISKLEQFKPSPDVNMYIFDVSSLESIDSTGAAALSNLVTRIRERGGISNAYGAAESIRDLYSLLGTESSLMFCGSEREALANRGSQRDNKTP